MEIQIYCMSCKVHILRADTDTLKTPLIGNMFQVKKDMEWSLFSPHDVGFDLICPMCDSTFHYSGDIMVSVNGGFITGKPEIVIPGILTTENSNGGVAKEETHLPETFTDIQEKNLIVEKERSIGTIEKQNQDKINEQFAEPDNTLNNLMDKVEGKSDSPTESPEGKPPEPIADPVIQSIQDQVEVKEKEPEKPEPPTINNGPWSDNLDTNEASETMGRAPSGTVPAEESDEMSGKAPPGTKVADSGKIKFKGSKRSRAFFKKAKV